MKYRDENPEDFTATMQQLRLSVTGKEPTIAHKALARYQIPIITMNVDSLHTIAGSKLVYEIHGSYREDNVVLYGQSIRHAEEAEKLIINTGVKALETGVTAYLLVVGTSLQTEFANYLIGLAIRNNFYVKRIDSNADVEVSNFLKQVFSLEL